MRTVVNAAKMLAMTAIAALTLGLYVAANAAGGGPRQYGTRRRVAS